MVTNHIIGIVVAIIGSFVNSLGLLLQKLAHVRNAALPPERRTLKWVVGEHGKGRALRHATRCHSECIGPPHYYVATTHQVATSSTSVATFATWPYVTTPHSRLHVLTPHTATVGDQPAAPTPDQRLTSRVVLHPCPNLLHAQALTLTAQTTVSGLSPLVLVGNVLFAPFIVGERPQCKHLVATLVVLMGSTTMTLFGPNSPVVATAHEGCARVDFMPAK